MTPFDEFERSHRKRIEASLKLHSAMHASLIKVCKYRRRSIPEDLDYLCMTIWEAERLSGLREGDAGDRESVERVGQFIAAADALKCASASLLSQAKVETGNRANVASEAIASMGSMRSPDEDPSKAGQFQRGGHEIDEMLQRLEWLVDDARHALERHPAIAGAAPNRDRQETIRQLFFAFRRTFPRASVAVNRKGWVTGDFVAFYGAIEHCLPERLRFNNYPGRSEGIGAALRGELD